MPLAIRDEFLTTIEHLPLRESMAYVEELLGLLNDVRIVSRTWPDDLRTGEAVERFARAVARAGEARRARAEEG